MKTHILTAALVFLAAPAFAKEYVVKEISDPAGDKPYYFAPDKLTIQPGDTVTFVNDQDDMHDVMFVEVPKGVDEMIMSPAREKEGQKWSHSFNVPGTYEFHCHAHEALGMKGTLIVGHASKQGETVRMDHHKMAEKAAGKEKSVAPVAAEMIQATGKVNSIDAASGAVNITHDPIKALNWPRMKMEFMVDKSVALSGFKAGDSVSFMLKPEGDDNYVVTKMNKRN